MSDPAHERIHRQPDRECLSCMRSVLATALSRAEQAERERDEARAAHRAAVMERVSLGKELIRQRDEAVNQITDICDILEWHEQDEGAPVADRVRYLAKRLSHLTSPERLHEIAEMIAHDLDCMFKIDELSPNAYDDMHQTICATLTAQLTDKKEGA